MVTQAEVQGWAGGLDAVLGRIASWFVRTEPRRRAAAYLRGLLAPAERKNGWQLAKAAGDAIPDGVQDVLSRLRFDPSPFPLSITGLMESEDGMTSRKARAGVSCARGSDGATRGRADDKPRPCLERR